jgi:hypothetical protein
MPRNINEKLIVRLTLEDLVPLLNYIKTETKRLRLEVRQAGKFFVYYKKCKILDVGINNYYIDEKYFENNQKPKNIKELIINNPQLYFKDTILVVDRWLTRHPKAEFVTQQNIASENQDINDRYIILDMEYNFSQSGIIAEERVKKAGFDLLGIERKTGKIVFFEVKKGLKALNGKAGIKTHILDFEECLYGKHKVEFRNSLIEDVKCILSDKNRLGLIDNFNLPLNLTANDVELIFVFERGSCDQDDYLKIYNTEHRKSRSTRTFRTIYVTNTYFKLR